MLFHSFIFFIIINGIIFVYTGFSDIINKEKSLFFINF